MERPEQALFVPMEPFLIRLNAEKLFGTFFLALMELLV
jgi:hypothetical protein